MKLREQIKKDIGTFLNNDEFSEEHDVDGRLINGIIDSDSQRGRSLQPTDLFNASIGISIGQIMFYVQESVLGERPVVDQNFRLNGKLYRVSSCDENMGLLEIGLEANEA